MCEYFLMLLLCFSNIHSKFNMSPSAIVTSSRTYSEDQAPRTGNGLQPRQRIRTAYRGQAMKWHASWEINTHTHTRTKNLNAKASCWQRQTAKLLTMTRGIAALRRWMDVWKAGKAAAIIGKSAVNKHDNGKGGQHIFTYVYCSVYLSAGRGSRIKQRLAYSMYFVAWRFGVNANCHVKRSLIHWQGILHICNDFRHSHWRYWPQWLLIEARVRRIMLLRANIPAANPNMICNIPTKCA